MQMTDTTEAINRAADDVLALIGPSDSARALVDLVVNVAVAYLAGTASTAHDAIRASYTDDPETVLNRID